MRRVYLLSSLIVPLSFETKIAIVKVEEVDVRTARELLREGFKSAVGHEPTAKFLSKTLGVPVKCSRETLSLRPGDTAIAVQFRERVQKRELTEEELNEIFKEGGLRIIRLEIVKDIKYERVKGP